MNELEQKRLRRRVMTKFLVLVGIKAVVYAGIYYTSRKLQDDRTVLVVDESLTDFTNPYTTKISDGSLGSIVRWGKE